MKNEKGLTLVELLVAIVIVGIIIVPLLTIMTGTFTRTVSQEKETQIAYIAQEVMEKVRYSTTGTLSVDTYCWSNINEQCESHANLPAPYSNLVIDEPVTVFVKVDPYEHEVDNFYQITVRVEKNSFISSGKAGLHEKENKIELVTVVFRPDE
ncbi:prepilin-type N-terminal cleavage/methylation domain-containing protein [Halalkalibacter krulwichiae]|uniref:prepilin-type N-terminal cleavage/methylation domain-containing protein n=1 Tax=Halalkalibacter krulwichiae TaxID=199441 RepID=UPI00082686E6|nr:prepilin-type N-terminal cleavage/methylation domain-containing protein [Halalkalibacter krulwichiae]